MVRRCASSRLQARALGISVIHQESVVFEDLSVAENIFVTITSAAPWPDRLASHAARSAELLANCESTLDPAHAACANWASRKSSGADRARAGHESRVVIMDEPTAALSHHEAQDLLRIVRGCAMPAAPSCSSATSSKSYSRSPTAMSCFAMASVGAGEIAGTTLDQLVSLMVGRAIDQVFPKPRAGIGAGGAARRSTVARDRNSPMSR